jgi:hypothetical protein
MTSLLLPSDLRVQRKKENTWSTILALSLYALMIGTAGCATLPANSKGNLSVPAIQSATLPGGSVSVTYTARVTVTGGTAPYAWAVSGGQLPTGLTFDSTTGVISGTPDQPGTFSFSTEVYDSSSPVRTASKSLSIAIAAATAHVTTQLQILSASLPNGMLNSLYSATFAANGGSSPYSWSISSGSLPAGLVLESSGQISGTPTRSGSFSLSVEVRDSSSPEKTASRTLGITITPGTTHVTTQLQVMTPSLPTGMVNSSYSATFTASGGTSPYSWSILSGTLPTGLAISSSGQISGKPTESESSAFTIGVKDSSSPQQTAAQAYWINITAGGTGVSLTDCGALSNTDTVYVLQNDVSSAGTCFSIQSDDITLNLNGHTVTYNTADQNYARYAVVGINCWDPDLTNGKANGNPCGGSFHNLTVFGGTLTEGSGAAANYAHVIRLGQNMSGGPTIYEVTFNFHSNSAQGIDIAYADNASGLGPIIHDNTFNNGVTQVVNRYQEDGASITILGCTFNVGLTSRIYQNTVIGGPQSGLRNNCNGGEVDHNSISAGNPHGTQSNGVCNPTLGCEYANDYGILAWGPKSNIHDNIVTPLEGRGIELTGNGVAVQNNTITNANEVENDAEYNGCEGSGDYGFQWDDKVSNSTASGNHVTAVSGVCTASALRLTDVPLTGNNTSVGNTYAATRTSTSLPCAAPQIGAPSGCAMAISTDMDNNTTGFTSTNDTFTGDSGIFWFDWDGAYNVTFINPTFNKGTTFPSTPWHFAYAVNGEGAVSNVHIRDATFGPGVDPTNNVIPARSANQAPVSIYIDRTYTLFVTNQNAGPVAGATVTITDTLGNRECSTATNAVGIAACVVTQERINNDTGANQVENRNPMTVSTEKLGCVTNAAKETVSQTMNRTIQLSCQ